MARVLRIGMQAWGTRGDIQPLIALGGALAARGHRVALAVSALDGVDYGAAGRARGVDVIMCDSGATVSATSAAITRLRGPRQLAVLMDRFLRPGEAAMEAAAAALAARSDVLVGHVLAHPLRAAAEERGVPWASVAFWPGMVPSIRHGPFTLRSFGHLGNSAAWRLLRIGVDRMVLPRIAPAWRRRGLRPPRCALTGVWFSPGLSLVAASPTLCALPAAWGPHRCTGEWRPAAALHAAPAPPAALERFLADGAPPALMTLGSLQRFDGAAVAARLAEAARLSGMRAIIPASGAAPPGSTVGGVHYVGELDHRAVLPSCALAVHHGGAGTSHAVALSGIPAVVLGVLEEQIDWGHQARRLGIASAPLRFMDASAAAIARAMRAVASDAAMRARAQAVGAAMSAERGLEQAVSALEEFADRARAGSRRQPRGLGAS
jgi:sterol 3beta-glucosyltransferase